MFFRGSYCNTLPVHLLSRSLFVSLHHVCHSPSLCAACIMTRYYYCTRRTMTDPNDLNLMHWIFCFYWCECFCFDFSKPVKCQVNFKIISQYLSLSLTHTHTTHTHTPHTPHTHTGGVGKNNCTTDDRVNGPLLKVSPPPELSFRIHGTGSDRFPFKSMCQLKSVQSRSSDRKTNTGQAINEWIEAYQWSGKCGNSLVCDSSSSYSDYFQGIMLETLL